MAKCFSKKYRNKGLTFNYLQSTSPPQEQEAKTNTVSVVRIEVFVLCTVEDGVGNTCIGLTMPP